MNAPSNETLSTLSQLGRDLYEAEVEVLRLFAELKRAKARRDAIQCTEIPEFLGEIGIKEFSTDQVSVRVEEVLTVQPRAENRPLILAELEKQGAGALVKSTVTVAFNRGEEEKAKGLVAYLQRMGHVPKTDKKVEPATLKKYVKTLLERGQSVDTELFGVRQFKKATFVDGAPEAPVFEDEENQ